LFQQCHLRFKILKLVVCTKNLFMSFLTHIPLWACLLIQLLILFFPFFYFSFYLEYSSIPVLSLVLLVKFIDLQLPKSRQRLLLGIEFFYFISDHFDFIMQRDYVFAHWLLVWVRINVCICSSSRPSDSLFISWFKPHNLLLQRLLFILLLLDLIVKFYIQLSVQVVIYRQLQGHRPFRQVCLQPLSSWSQWAFDQPTWFSARPLLPNPSSSNLTVQVSR